MGKKEDIKTRLKPILDDYKMLETFIIENSNLPGYRANIELAFALSEIYGDLHVLTEWSKIDEDIANVNDPKVLLPFCSAVCLGKIYTKNKDENIIRILKHLANDKRWRIREGVVFGLQIIGKSNFNDLKYIFSNWLDNSNNFEKRAILVTLAEPHILSNEGSNFAFNTLEAILLNMDRMDNFDVLRKGLNFTLSVYTVSAPVLGFTFMRKWIGKDDVIDKIIMANLKTDRLNNRYPDEVRNLLKLLKT